MFIVFSLQSINEISESKLYFRKIKYPFVERVLNRSQRQAAVAHRSLLLSAYLDHIAIPKLLEIDFDHVIAKRGQKYRRFRWLCFKYTLVIYSDNTT